MAHNGVIDRKALREYKALLTQRYDKDLAARVDRLEQLLAQGPKNEPEPETVPAPSADPGLPTKHITSRPQLLALTLEQLALTKFEKAAKSILNAIPASPRALRDFSLTPFGRTTHFPKTLSLKSVGFGSATWTARYGFNKSILRSSFTS